MHVCVDRETKFATMAENISREGKSRRSFEYLSFWARVRGGILLETVKVKYSEDVTIDFSRERRKNRLARLRICLRWKILNKKININKIKKLIKYWNKKVLLLFVSWESWSTIPSKIIVKVEFHSEQKRKWNGIVWKFSIEKKEERRERWLWKIVSNRCQMIIHRKEKRKPLSRPTNSFSSVFNPHRRHFDWLCERVEGGRRIGWFLKRHKESPG